MRRRVGEQDAYLKKRAVEYAKSRPLDYRRPAGSSTTERFMQRLRRIFGDEHIAWKVAYDKEDRGILNYQDFGKISRDLGITGELAAVWRALDVDGSGQITLDEFCPPA